MLSIILTSVLQPSSEASDRLLSGFLHPPQVAKPQTWWHWCNGSITFEGITKDLEELAEKGVAGVQIFNVAPGNPPGPILFMSPQWHELFKHAVKEASRLGLEVCVHNCAGWSSSGGPWIKPEYAMQKLTWSEVQVEGPRRLEAELPQPPTVAEFYRDIAVLAFPTPTTDWRIDNWEVKACFKVRHTHGERDSIQPDTRPLPPEAIVPKNRIIDLTEKFSNGRLVWDVPEGKWTIIRIGHTLTGARNAPAPDSGRGWEVDKLSREALDQHWQNAIVPLIEDSGPLAGKTFKNVLIDSYEMGSQNWTPKMREEFQKRCGYDLLPFLIVAAGGRVVDSLDISERFLWDFRRTIVDLFNDNYYGYFGELCRKHGLLLWVEPYGNGPFDDITAGSKADVPMGEFWLGRLQPGLEKHMNSKMVSSIAHIYGKQVVGAESFTAGPPWSGWVDYPYLLKPLGDLIFCSGVNRYVFHTYAHQPWLSYKPGNTMGPWGFQFNRNTTWWEDAPAWLTYVARCQYLLQQGLFVGDVLFYMGENSPVGIRLSQPLPPSYDFDACDTPTLLERLSVKGNKLVLPHGMSYEVLVLPNEREMTPKVLRKIGELIKAGAWVIGPKPLRSPSLVDYPRADEEVKKLADEIWGDLDGVKATERRYGKGRIFWGKKVEEVLAMKGVKPDFEFEGTLPGTAITYIHRRDGDVDIYFLSNQRERFETVRCRFRVKGKVPELWHPDTGKVERAPIFRFVEDRTELTLNFDPYGSVFVIFRQPTRERKGIVKVLRNGEDAFQPSSIATEIGEPPAARLSVTSQGKWELLAFAPGDYEIETTTKKKVKVEIASVPKPIEVEGPWEVHFPPNWGAPERALFEKLISWSEHPDEGIKYFSGTARYVKEIDIPKEILGKDKEIFLDLGDVEVIARAWLNGKDLGIIWKKPFQVDITDVVKAGRNVLEVEVTNLWVNRLIGDEHLPEHCEYNGIGREGSLKEIPKWVWEGKPSPTGRYTFAVWRHYSADSPLRVSGLLGPVRIIVGVKKGIRL
jgi:hypothetical protein